MKRYTGEEAHAALLHIKHALNVALGADLTWPEPEPDDVVAYIMRQVQEVSERLDALAESKPEWWWTEPDEDGDVWLESETVNGWSPTPALVTRCMSWSVYRNDGRHMFDAGNATTLDAAKLACEQALGILRGAKEVSDDVPR